MKNETNSKERKITLTEAIDRWFAAMAHAEESEGEVDADLEHLLEQAEGSIYEKLEGYAKYVQGLQVNIAQKVAHIEELDRQANLVRMSMKRTEKKVALLEDKMIYAIEALGVKKVETGVYTLSVRKSTRVEVRDEEKVPFRFKTSKIEFKLDNGRLAEALESGKLNPELEALRQKGYLSAETPDTRAIMAVLNTQLRDVVHSIDPDSQTKSVHTVNKTPLKKFLQDQSGENEFGAEIVEGKKIVIK